MTKNSPNKVNLRNQVLTMLLQVNEGKKSHLVLKETLDNLPDLEKQEKSFVTRLFQGTIERQIELDYIINCFSKTKTSKMKPVIREIIRMCVYQIKYMDSVKDFAACNEAVKLVQKRKLVNLKGFVNGVVRNIARSIEEIEYPTDYVDNLSVRYSVPKWIIEMWLEQYGKDIVENILDNLYDNNVTSVRCNTSKASVADIISALEIQNIKVEKSNVYDKALNISGYHSLGTLNVFQAGMVTVQNLSSMLVGIVANPSEGMNIIDVCAAPGGKSLHVAELMNGTGHVEARDLSKQKTDLIEENISRIRYKNITTKVWDATVLDEAAVGTADIVIADLPCSGLGVIGNKSDIKLNVTREQIDELAKLQREILLIVNKYLKPDGLLVFSTCTINTIENNENVEWIKENLDMDSVSLTDTIPKELDNFNTLEEGYIQILNGQEGMDGFFISAFRKKA